LSKSAEGKCIAIISKAIISKANKIKTGLCEYAGIRVFPVTWSL
jgi:hypothetical protein